MWSSSVDPAPGPMLLAVEAVPQSQAVVAAGFVWNVRPPREIAETVSRAIYELERAGVHARGLIRTARTGRVADEIVYAAHKHHADEIVIGTSRRSWWGALVMGSVAPQVLRRSDFPVVAVPTTGFVRRQRSASAVSV